MTTRNPSPNPLKSARKADDRLARRVSRAIQAGDIKAAKDATALRLKSPTSLLAAADRFNKGQPEDERLSAEQLVEAVSRVDIRRDSVEPAQEVVLRKDDGSSRVTYDFSISDRIAQTLLTMCLERFAPLFVCDCQFGHKGTGSIEAVAMVDQHVANGCEWAAELDIENCFGSINRDALVNLLPLPSAVVRARVAPSVVMVTDSATLAATTALRAATTALRADRVSPVFEAGEITSGVLGTESSSLVVTVSRELCANTAPSIAPPARQGRGGVVARRVPFSGLPQGGLHSSIAAAIVLGQVLAGMEHRIGNTFLLVWGDNILVLGRTRNSVRKTARHLQSAFRQASAGPLNARLRYVRHVDKGFEWIGFKFRRREQGDLLVTATPKNMRKFCNRAARMDRRAIRGWRAYFAPHWPNCVRWTQRVLRAAASKVPYNFRLTGHTGEMAKRALELAGMSLPAAGRSRKFEIICRDYIAHYAEESLENHLALLKARFGVTAEVVGSTEQHHSRQPEHRRPI